MKKKVRKTQQTNWDKRRKKKKERKSPGATSWFYIHLYQSVSVCVALPYRIFWSQCENVVIIGKNGTN